MGVVQVYLGMERPDEVYKTAIVEEDVLIWGAGTSVGAYAVQYAKKRELSLAKNLGFKIFNVKQVGYTVIATASPRGFTHLEELGASQVFDYKSTDNKPEFRSLGLFKFMMTASDDVASQQAIGKLLQPIGGGFASTLGGSVDLPITSTESMKCSKPQLRNLNSRVSANGGIPITSRKLLAVLLSQRRLRSEVVDWKRFKRQAMMFR